MTLRSTLLLAMLGLSACAMPRNEPEVPLLDASGFQVGSLPASAARQYPPGSAYTLNRPGTRPEVVTVGAIRPSGVSAGRILEVRTDDDGVPEIVRANDGVGSVAPSEPPRFMGTRSGSPIMAPRGVPN
jgi:hypothetical protein